MRLFVLLPLSALLACTGRPPSPQPLILERRAEAAGVRLVLVAEPGLRINARLKPALERPDGTVLRFETGRLTADSAYFADAPSLVVPPDAVVRGTLRASVCSDGEQVCRIVEQEVS